MSSCPPDKELANYHSLLERIDQLCLSIAGEFAAAIVCRAGCSGCCRHLSLFPVEAAGLVRAVRDLPGEVRRLLAGRTDLGLNSSCPLLVNDCCAVYLSRPVICRTHGLPLLAVIAGKQTLDCCPENFRNVEALPGSAIINLETLNNTLVAINSLFVAETADRVFQQVGRFSIAEIIRLAVETENL
jgi:Fe-S-cluster containining protein